MENRLDTLNQYKSEIFELKKKLAEKEAEYLDVSKEMFEQDTGWEFGKTVLTNKNGPVNPAQLCRTTRRRIYRNRQRYE